MENKMPNLVIPEGSRIVFDEENAYIVNQQGIPIYAFTNVTLMPVDSKQDHSDELPPSIEVKFSGRCPQSKELDGKIGAVAKSYYDTIANAKIN